VPATQSTEADKIAEAAFHKAIAFVGRMPNVDFNRSWVTFNFVAGTKSYDIGKDIVSRMSDIMNAQELYSTDNTQPIRLLGLGEYRSITGGMTGSGRPTYATIHSATKTLEVYPTPDGSYEYGFYVQKAVNSFADIPSAYHDIVIDIGVLNVRALSDQTGQIAMMLAKKGLDSMAYDNIVGWSGSTVRPSRGLDPGKGGIVPDSGNLRGD